MGLYRNGRSPFWWAYLETSRVRKSTKIRINGDTPEQSRENKRLAERQYHLWMAERHRDRLGLSERPTVSFSAHVEWYRAHVSAHKRGAVRESEILNSFEVLFGALSIHEITVDRVREWQTARLEDVSPSTVNRELDVLKHVIGTAVPHYLPANPIAGLPRLRTARADAEDIVILSRNDEARLLDTLDLDDKALVLLALCTLLRLGDLLDLRWADYHGTWLSVRSPKTGRPYRVPVAARARAAVDALSRGSDYIFTDRRRGTEAERRARVSHALRYACKRADVRYGRRRGGITFHSFRHTGASRMLEAGVDPRTVQELGGWSSLAMVMRYTHPTAAHKRAAVDLI